MPKCVNGITSRVMFPNFFSSEACAKSSHGLRPVGYRSSTCTGVASYSCSVEGSCRTKQSSSSNARLPAMWSLMYSAACQRRGASMSP
eukprot:8659636-Pyramimonas_sp.AAC.1